MSTQKMVENKFKDVTITRVADMKISLPEDMPLLEAAKWLSRLAEQEEEVVKDERTFNCDPLDGALALWKAIKEVCGFSVLVPTPSFFGKIPPTIINVKTGPGPEDTEACPWGRIAVPGFEEGFLTSNFYVDNGKPRFVVVAEVKQKFKNACTRIFNVVQRILDKESIYRGKAVKVAFDYIASGNYSPTENAPQFLDLSEINSSKLVFTDEVQNQINFNIFTPIKYSDSCRKNGIPLKRGVLLEGPYGVGKTLTAYVTAKMCEENGWTFLYLRDVKHLVHAIEFASMYQPAVIFAEDVDRAVAGTERTSTIDAVLNTIDGVDSKNKELMIVLTTNHVETINAAMFRAGRLDAVISVKAPDHHAVERLVQQYACGTLMDDEDYSETYDMLAGQIPATIREVVERAKLAELSVKGPSENGELLTISSAALRVAAGSMKMQLDLLNRTVAEKLTPEQLVGHGIGAVITSVFEGNFRNRDITADDVNRVIMELTARAASK